MLHLKFGFDWPSGFRGEDFLNCGWTDDGRMLHHGHPMSSPCETNGSGELKTKHNKKCRKKICLQSNPTK